MSNFTAQLNKLVALKNYGLKIRGVKTWKVLANTDPIALLIKLRKADFSAQTASMLGVH